MTQKVSFFDLVFAVLLYRKLEMFLMIFTPFLNKSGIFFGCKEPSLVTWQLVGYTALPVSGFCRILVKCNIRNNTIRLDTLLNFGIREQVRDLVKPIEPTKPLKQNRRDIHVHPTICGYHMKSYEIRKRRLPSRMGRVSSNGHELSLVVRYVLVQVGLVEYDKGPVLFLAYGSHF